MGYETKDSGERMEFATGMKRDTNQGKPRFDLTEPLEQPWAERLSTRLAELMARGAEKYGDRNWEKARTKEELLRYLDSAERHFRQWLQQIKYRASIVDTYFDEPEIMDEDHAAAVFFNLIGAEYVAGRVQRDVEAESAKELSEDNGERAIFFDYAGTRYYNPRVIFKTLDDGFGSIRLVPVEDSAWIRRDLNAWEE